MIQNGINALVSILQFIINLIMTPLNEVITSYFPQIEQGFEYISDFFEMIIGFIPWVLSWFNLPTLFIDLIIGYWVFKLTVPYIVHGVKLAVAWWDSIVA